MNSFHARAGHPRAKPIRSKSRPTATAGIRADQLLVERGLAPSRSVAQRWIEAGRVAWTGGAVTKAALILPASAELVVAADAGDRFVSRGGLKLAGALVRTGIDVAGRRCLDLGQSTGGFTDCLLQAGAARVVGVEVGHGQLHPKLRTEPRVVCLEGINGRALTAEALPETDFDLIVADLSFISLALVLPQLPPLLAAAGDALLLVKPQFELGPQHLGKGGIVRDGALYPLVESKLRAAGVAAGLVPIGYFPSPILGGDGNHEFFIWMRHGHN